MADKMDTDGGDKGSDEKKNFISSKNKDDMSISTKKKEDFGPLLEASIPQNRDLALKEGKKAEAIENLLTVEKQTRLAGDAIATGKVAVEIVKILYETKDWEGINSHVILLSKRRQQLKQVLVEIVQEAMKYIDSTPTEPIKLELIHTLRAVTDGKIHVELERARLTRTLAKMKEAEGKIAEAADLMQEVQVETYGSMEKEEKVDYILEQVRLCLDKGDFVRGAIVSKKISSKTFKDDQLQELKLRYYELLNRIANEKDEYFEMAQNFHEMWNTPSLQDKPEKWMPLLKSVVVLLILSPHDNHQHDFLVRLLEEKKLEQISPYKVLLSHFKTMELIQWSSFQELYKAELQSHAAFQGDKGKKRWDDLQARVVQHNIRVVSTYYTNIRMGRLAQLLELSQEDAEKSVCDMVVAGSLWCRIDRLKGIATFTPTKDPRDTLNSWSNNISELLGKVEKICHLIHKETMLHNVAKQS
uniref:PCI domain-containing protein n=1 Tax=Hanusia phi TaxID=3032 RepID=A0A7S0HEG8_9CRYP